VTAIIQGNFVEWALIVKQAEGVTLVGEADTLRLTSFSTSVRAEKVTTRVSRICCADTDLHLRTHNTIEGVVMDNAVNVTLHGIGTNIYASGQPFRAINNQWEG